MQLNIGESAGQKRPPALQRRARPTCGQGQGRVSLGRFFLVRRQRVCAQTRPAVDSGETGEQQPCDPDLTSKRPATLRSASSGGPAASGAGRATPTEGRGTTGGAVRFAVGADCCGALSCGETEGLLEVERDGETRVLCPECARRWSE